MQRVLDTWDDEVLEAGQSRKGRQAFRALIDAGSMQASSPDGKIRLTKVQGNLSNHATASWKLVVARAQDIFMKDLKKTYKRQELNFCCLGPKIVECNLIVGSRRLKRKPEDGGHEPFAQLPVSANC